MNTLINFVSGRVLAPVWDFLDGKKTYIAGSVSILSGLAGIAAEFVPALSAHDTAALIALLKHLPADPSYLLLVAGLGGVGIGGKLQKVADASATSAVIVAPPQS